jgi:ribose-phosphate pyrophosphokinase
MPLVPLEALVNRTRYPSGERHVELRGGLGAGERPLAAGVRDFNDVAELVLVDGLLRDRGYDPRWVAPFLPFARDDRRRSAADAFELGLALELLRGVRVCCVDPHSDVLGSWVSHVRQPEVLRVAVEAYPALAGCVLAAPDAGATKKAEAGADAAGMDLVRCSKRRDPRTGALSGFDVGGPTPVAGRDVLLVDDICDGGGTFVGLAAALREAGASRVDLLVTHGLFTKGLGGLAEVLGAVYTLDCYLDPPPYAGPGSFLLPVSLENLIETSPEF